MNARWFPHFLRVGLLLLLAVTTFAPSVPAARSDATRDTRLASYIVVFKDGVNAKAVAQEQASRHAIGLTHVYSRALNGYAARIPEAWLERIRADRRVQFVSPDVPVRLEAQSLPTGVNRIDGDRNPAAQDTANVGVAIIDSGISNHSDLNIRGGTNCVPGTNTAGGYSDGTGHGTHVAGIVGAKNNGNYVVGVAPGAPLYAVRSFDDTGLGSWSTIICGIDWVTANAARLNIKVANMSLSGEGSDDENCGNRNNDALHRAICRSVAAGITYVVSAGNEGVDFADRVPAAYDEVLTVSAIADTDGRPGGAGPGCGWDDDTVADVSNYTTVDNSDDIRHTIAAPGACIISTSNEGGTIEMSGTSMAAPHVAGAAILCIASGTCAGLSPSQIVAKIRNDAESRAAATARTSNYYGFIGDPRSPIDRRYYGYLVYAGSLSSASPTSTPTSTSTGPRTPTPTRTLVPTSTAISVTTPTPTPTTSPAIPEPGNMNETLYLPLALVQR